jgi:hypothetical protein
VQMWAGVSLVVVQNAGRGEPSPSADLSGMSPVPAQMWAGVSPVPEQMWALAHQPRQRRSRPLRMSCQRLLRNAAARSFRYQHVCKRHTTVHSYTRVRRSMYIYKSTCSYLSSYRSICPVDTIGCHIPHLRPCPQQSCPRRQACETRIGTRPVGLCRCGHGWART